MHLSTVEGDLVLDPFGGSGTTFDVCEHHDRYWLGSEIESCDVIIERLSAPNVRFHRTDDYIEPAVV